MTAFRKCFLELDSLPTHRFVVAAAQRKRHAHRFAVVAMKLEAVRTPALITLRHGDIAVMPTLRTWRHGPALDQRAVYT
jgi:hypothetical protein